MSVSCTVCSSSSSSRRRRRKRRLLFLLLLQLADTYKWSCAAASVAAAAAEEEEAATNCGILCSWPARVFSNTLWSTRFYAKAQRHRQIQRDSVESRGYTKLCFVSCCWVSGNDLWQSSRVSTMQLVASRSRAAGLSTFFCDHLGRFPVERLHDQNVVEWRFCCNLVLTTSAHSSQLLDWETLELVGGRRLRLLLPPLLAGRDFASEGGSVWDFTLAACRQRVGL